MGSVGDGALGFWKALRAVFPDTTQQRCWFPTSSASDSWTPEQKDAVELAATLADELIEADALLFAVPLYNFGVSQHFKAYIDLVITDPRMGGPGTPPPLAGKPAELVIVRGAAATRRALRGRGWDHSTGWVRRILEGL